jgi:hypothetical protein
MRRSSHSNLVAKSKAAHWRAGAFTALALFIAASSGCHSGIPDPLLAAGEQALIGSYALNNLLLAPGKVIVPPHRSSLFDGMGDTPDQAVKKGFLRSEQAAVLQRKNCTMTIQADHRFVITNLPSADFSQTFTATGVWSIAVYHVFDAYGYRISLKTDKSPGLQAKFFNADKPSPPVVEIFYKDGKKDGVIFRFAKTGAP